MKARRGNLNLVLFPLSKKVSVRHLDAAIPVLEVFPYEIGYVQKMPIWAACGSIVYNSKNLEPT